jgi:hypothetical protein
LHHRRFKRDIHFSRLIHRQIMKRAFSAKNLRVVSQRLVAGIV